MPFMLFISFSTAYPLSAVRFGGARPGPADLIIDSITRTNCSYRIRHGVAPSRRKIPRAARHHTSPNRSEQTVAGTVVVLPNAKTRPHRSEEHTSGLQSRHH